MPKLFDVVIQARITKTIRVEAKDVDEAYELAHESFSVLNDGFEERYEQETIELMEVGDSNTFVDHEEGCPAIDGFGCSCGEK